MGPEPHPAMAGRGNRARLSLIQGASLRPRLMRWPLITMIIVGLSVALPRWPTTEQFLQFDRATLLNGQIWRLLTCHLAHWSASHEIWSVGAFAVQGLLGEIRDRRAIAMCCIAAALACSLALLLFWPDVQIYRGMSGVDSALFTWLVVFNLRASSDHRYSAAHKIALGLLLIAFVAKVAWEALSHHSLFVPGDGRAFVSLPGVHAVGGAVGICVGMFRPRPFFQLEDRYN
jgi:rhomboid family GlyGly-CTERM serine protease